MEVFLFQKTENITICCFSWVFSVHHLLALVAVSVTAFCAGAETGQRWCNHVRA